MANDHFVDIHELLDQLEQHVNERPRMFRSNRAAVDIEYVMAIIDRVREALPTEFSQARRVLQDRQKIYLDAQIMAEGMLGEAQDRAEELISEHGLLAAASAQGEAILRHARDVDQRTRQNLDAFASEQLAGIADAMRISLSDLDEVTRTLQARLGDISAARESIAGARAPGAG